MTSVKKINTKLKKKGGYNLKQKTLKEYREKRELTRPEVAKLINKTVTFVYMLETGRRKPSDKTKEQLAKLYGCDISDIYLALKLTES